LNKLSTAGKNNSPIIEYSIFLLPYRANGFLTSTQVEAPKGVKKRRDGHKKKTRRIERAQLLHRRSQILHFANIA